MNLSVARRRTSCHGYGNKIDIDGYAAIHPRIIAKIMGFTRTYYWRASAAMPDVSLAFYTVYVTGSGMNGNVSKCNVVIMDKTLVKCFVIQVHIFIKPRLYDQGGISY